MVQAADANDPVYVHTNGANAFLESVVVVRPDEKVVFVNEDTDMHTILGYHPETGKPDNTIAGKINGTPGSSHPVSTYTVSIKKPGIYTYYCSMHAHLAPTYHGMVQPALNKGVDGYGGAMAGEIIVTTDAALTAINPPSSHTKILKDYFGG